MFTPTAGDKTTEAVVMRRVFWRLMPFLLAAYLVCYIDRVNIGFASHRPPLSGRHIPWHL